LPVWATRVAWDNKYRHPTLLPGWVPAFHRKGRGGFRKPLYRQGKRIYRLYNLKLPDGWEKGVADRDNVIQGFKKGDTVYRYYVTQRDQFGFPWERRTQRPWIAGSDLKDNRELQKVTKVRPSGGKPVSDGTSKKFLKETDDIPARPVRPDPEDKDRHPQARHSYSGELGTEVPIKTKTGELNIKKIVLVWYEPDGHLINGVVQYCQNTIKPAELWLGDKSCPRLKLTEVKRVRFPDSGPLITFEHKTNKALLPPGWTTGKSKSQNGRTYYISPKGEPQWEKPRYEVKISLPKGQAGRWRVKSR